MVSLRNDKLHKQSLFVVTVLCILAVGSTDTSSTNTVPTSQPVQETSGQTVQQPVRQTSSIEGVRAAVLPIPKGKSLVSDVQYELIATWKNTGTTNIHAVKADINLLGSQGEVIDQITYTIYVADGWEFGRPTEPGASSGIPPGFTYTDPPGDGYFLTHVSVAGQAVVPSGAVITGLHITD
jgi:hypothetical protein